MQNNRLWFSKNRKEYTHTHTITNRSWHDWYQQRELISLLLQPHLQHALDSPTTTSRPFLLEVRRASSTSSEIMERAGRMNSEASCPPRTISRAPGSVLCWRENFGWDGSTKPSAVSLMSEPNRSRFRSSADKAWVSISMGFCLLHCFSERLRSASYASFTHCLDI